MTNVDIAIKLGGNEITIFKKSFGIVAKELAFLAVEKKGIKTKVKAIGEKAQKLIHLNSNLYEVCQPIVNGEIVNEKMAVILINEMLKKVLINTFTLVKIRALVAISSAFNEMQLIKIKKVLNECGINSVEFVQNAVCVREDLNLEPNSYAMIVDIGKNLTDISILNGLDFNFGRVYFIGGENCDKNLSTFIEDNHNLKVLDLDCELIKNELASLYDNDKNKMEFVGFDENNRMIKDIISAEEVKLAILNVYETILGFVQKILSEQSKHIVKDIYTNGIIFVGGCSAVPGFYEYLKKKFEVPVMVPNNPEDCVILGAGKLLSKNGNFLKIKL